MTSFQAALDAGLDGVELDVRRCLDGTLVVHHDERLFDGRPISACTYAQLRPHPVPTLSEVCAWAAGRGAYLNVEIKYETLRPDERVRGTAELLKGHGLTHRTIVSSFNPWVLAELRRVAPELERAFLYDRWPAPMLRVAGRLDLAALHPHHSFVTPELVGLARRRGWRLNVWTVNEEARARELLRLGVDGLIGDVPDVLLGAAHELQ